MKFLFLFFILFGSCSAIPAKGDSKSISKVQECWNFRSLICIKKYFGNPQKEASDSISYLQNGNEYLTVFIDKKEQLIKGVQFWLYDPFFLDAKTIKKILPSDDWSMESLPEKNPHVVNLAVTNFSKKLGVSFLTYQLDKGKPVRVIYWGGDYKNLEF